MPHDLTTSERVGLWLLAVVVPVNAAGWLYVLMTGRWA